MLTVYSIQSIAMIYNKLAIAFLNIQCTILAKAFHGRCDTDLGGQAQ